MIIIILCITVIGGIVGSVLKSTNLNRAQRTNKVVVLGMDGLDPNILDKLMAEGKLPNFSKLKDTGSYRRLRTSTPPESAVAWSCFITGCNPGGHGIFGFLHRDPLTYLPYLTLADSKPPEKSVTIGDRKIPLGSSTIVSYLKGNRLWNLLSKEGIPSVIIRCPVTFPPDEIQGRMLSGFGVPDLLGTEGTFSFYTTHPGEQTKLKDMGGKIFKIEVKDSIVETNIIGPENSLLKKGEKVKIPLRIEIDRENQQVTISLQGKKEVLKVGNWSKWWRVQFNFGILTRVSGICRFYLSSIEPEFGLYLSPLNFDPNRPAFPISYPKSYAKELAEEIGLYHTLGQAGETWALNEGRIDEEAALTQYYKVIREREEMLDKELKNFKEGLLFCYFGITDIIQHMFWRFMDKEHPMYDEDLANRYRDVIPQMYMYMDKVLGRTMDYIDRDTTLIVLSDHGFSTLHKAVHINAWLHKNGFLELKAGYLESDEFFHNVDWSRTKAYALGLGGGIYINQIWREKHGIVVPGEETEELKNEIAEKLKNLVDPETGEKVVHTVYRKEEIFHGPYTGEAPDLVVGFEKGYRTSWQTALGGTPSQIFELNKKRWSGDHLFDSTLVPGILLINRKIKVQNPDIIDLAPTILKLLGVEIPEEMDGEPLL